MLRLAAEGIGIVVGRTLRVKIQRGEGQDNGTSNPEKHYAAKAKADG
ncbi:MAG: hypothetical protein ABSF70_00710 [Terracidiphilus sp.]